MTRVRRTLGRPGFTLVELLVVVVLMIVIAALTVAVLNAGFVSSQQVTTGADRVGQWLLISKQRAKRDGAPRGVRFFLTPVTGATTVPNSYQVQEAQYIEAPDAWSPNAAGATNPGGGRIAFVYKQDDVTDPMGSPPRPTYQIKPQPDGRRVFFVSNNPSDLIEFDQRVAVGDYLLLPDFGTSYRITGIQNPPAGPPSITDPLLPTPPTPPVLTPLNAREIALATFPDLGPAASNAPGVNPAIMQPTLTTYQFGFQAAPRPLLGEPTLLVGSSVVVDYRAARVPLVGGSGYRDWSNPQPATFPNPAPYWPTTTAGVYPDPTGAYFDVLFAPSGQVLYNPNPLIVLWVRGADKVDHPRLGDPTSASPSQLDTRASYDEAGAQVLVVVYVRSGLIATHPVSPPPAAPQAYDPYKNAKDGINSGL